MALGRVFLQTLGAFAEQQNVDPDVVRDIRARWVGRILAATSFIQLKALWQSGLLGDLLGETSPYTLAFILKRSMRRLMHERLAPPGPADATGPVEQVVK